MNTDSVTDRELENYYRVKWAIAILNRVNRGQGRHNWELPDAIEQLQQLQTSLKGFCECEEDIETQCPTIITASQCSEDNYPHIGLVTTCYGCDGELLATVNGWEHTNPRQEKGTN